MMMNRKWQGWFLVVFLLVPAVAYAEATDFFARFRPYLSLQEQYSSNIRLTPRDAREDYITTASPGISFSAGEKKDPRFGADLDYRLGLVGYARNPDLNYVAHYGTVNAFYSFTPHWTVRLREYFQQSQDPREQQYTPGSATDQYYLGTQRDRSTYYRNVFEPSMTYQYGKEDRVDFAYRNMIYHNSNPSIPESRENFFNPRLTHWFDIRNGVVLDYGLTFAQFQQVPGFTGNMVKGRYIYRTDPRTSYFAETSYLRRDFESPGVSYDVYTPSVGVEHAFSPTLSMRLQAGYFWQTPAQGSGTSGFSYDAGLTQRDVRTTYALVFQGGYREDYFTAENLGFTKYHRMVGTISHRLMERVQAGINGSLEWMELGTGRRDWIWSGGGTLSYSPLRWLTAYLDLVRREDQSNLDNFGYRETRATVRLTVTSY